MFRTYFENDNNIMIEGIKASNQNLINITVEQTYLVPGSRAPQIITRRI